LTTAIESNRVRVIDGRRIEKETRGGIIMWREVELVPASVEERFDRLTGERRTIQRPAMVKELRRMAFDPAGEVERLQREQPNGWRVLDPREPSALHDELDAAVKAGFAALVEEFHARNKVKPRVVLTGLPLGQCFRSRGTLAAWLTDDALRLRLQSHAGGSWGVHGSISDAPDLVEGCDELWVPPLFSVGIQNAVAIKLGKGLVRSIYPETFEKTRGVEEIRIVTWIGQATYIYIPSRDSMS
jgi:hypothetical protein